MNYPQELVDTCRYTASDKQAHRRGGAVGFRGYNTDSVFLMPYFSDEAWYVQRVAEFEDDQFLIVEGDYGVARRMLPHYDGVEIRVDRLHRAIDQSDRVFSAGHADFIGNVNSCNYTNKTSTWTFDLIEALAGKVADEACFAFTHKKDVRAGSKMISSYAALLGDVLDEEGRSELGLLDFTWRLCLNGHNAGHEVNYALAFHPTTLIACKFYAVFGETHQVQVESAFDYLSSVDNEGRPQRLKMNKTTVSLSRGQTTLDTLLKSVRDTLER